MCYSSVVTCVTVVVLHLQHVTGAVWAHNCCAMFDSVTCVTVVLLHMLQLWCYMCDVLQVPCGPTTAVRCGQRMWNRLTADCGTWTEQSSMDSLRSVTVFITYCSLEGYMHLGVHTHTHMYANMYTHTHTEITAHMHTQAC